MAAKKIHRIRIDLPPEYNRQEREAIADDVLEFIRERTEKGKDKNNKNFPGYSESYRESLAYKVGKGRSGKVNLTLSGDMLAAMDLKKQGKGYIEIGFSSGSENDKAEGNILGTYGNQTPLPKKQRDFLGIKPAELKKILKDHKAEATIAAKEAAAKAARAIEIEEVSKEDEEDES